MCKWYAPCDDTDKEVQKTEVHRLVTSRNAQFTNFVEYRTHKLVYRRYAGIYFIICIEISDNEMAYLELIHLLVQTLDNFFTNVCELDLLFNFHKVYMIIDEMILAGEVQEVSIPTIVERVRALEEIN